MMLVAASVLMLAGLLLVSAINVIEARWFAVVLVRTPALAVLQNIAVKIGSTAVFIFVVGLIFYFVPNAEVRFRDVWVGAVVTGLLWRGTLFGFSLYLRMSMARLANVHGSIAAVVVFLVWIYTCAVLFLYGVEVTAANARLRRHRPEEIPAAPAPRM
jgi:membrane protein